MTVTRIRTAAVLAACALVVGCSDRPRMATVKGTVTLDGAPLVAGTVTFESPGLRPATAKIVRGELTEVSTFEPNDGAPVGSHSVAVAASEDAASAVVADPGQATPKGSYMVGKSIIPRAYNDPATSKLTVEVTPGENVVELKLFSTGPK